MRGVSIVGIGQTKVGEHWEKSLRQLASEAILAAMNDANVEGADALYVGNMLSGEVSGQEQLGTLLADFVGLRGIEAVKVEAAGASGAAALRMGYLAVAGGSSDFVIVCGVEKMTDEVGSALISAISLSLDGDYEAIYGLSIASACALLMRRYMHEYDVKREEFAGFVINAHKNAFHNPYAMFKRPVTEEAYRKALMIAEPISLLDSPPICDGAAAVVLCPTKEAQKLRESHIRIIASAASTDALAIHDRRAPLFLKAAHDSARKAYEQARIGPVDIDVFELHDSFPIIAALSLEACGFAERGEGVNLAKEGEISLEGRIPISTMGGLKARGHPIGATGLYQIVEIVEQLRGMAGENQVKNCRIGMAQSIGGSGATAITHILARG